MWILFHYSQSWKLFFLARIHSPFTAIEIQTHYAEFIAFGFPGNPVDFATCESTQQLANKYMLLLRWSAFHASVPTIHAMILRQRTNIADFVVSVSFLSHLWICSSFSQMEYNVFAFDKVTNIHKSNDNRQKTTTEKVSREAVSAYLWNISIHFLNR